MRPPALGFALNSSALITESILPFEILGGLRFVQPLEPSLPFSQGHKKTRVRLSRQAEFSSEELAVNDVSDDGNHRRGEDCFRIQVHVVVAAFFSVRNGYKNRASIRQRLFKIIFPRSEIPVR